MKRPIRLCNKDCRKSWLKIISWSNFLLVSLDSIPYIADNSQKTVIKRRQPIYSRYNQLVQGDDE